MSAASNENMIDSDRSTSDARIKIVDKGQNKVKSGRMNCVM